MIAIKAVVRDGRIETETPLNLPDGTELRVSLAEECRDAPDPWDNSPEGIEAWLKWDDARPRLKMTPEEEADTDDWLRKSSAHGVENPDIQAEGLFP